MSNARVIISLPLGDPLGALVNAAGVRHNRWNIVVTADVAIDSYGAQYSMRFTFSENLIDSHGSLRAPKSLPSRVNSDPSPNIRSWT